MQKNLFTVFPFYKYSLKPCACSGEFLYFFTVIAFLRKGYNLYNGIKKKKKKSLKTSDFLYESVMLH